MIKTLYHGTNAIFEKFENKYLHTENSLMQYGSGFYFYEEPSQTILHGDLRVVTKVKINKSIEHTDRWNPTTDDIESLILKSPSLV